MEAIDNFTHFDEDEYTNHVKVTHTLMQTEICKPTNLQQLQSSVDSVIAL